MDRLLIAITRGIMGNKYAFIAFAMTLMLSPALLIAACMPVAPVTPVTPLSDALPEPQPMPYTCAQTGDSVGFVLTCNEPTPTPTATPTPSFWYFACSGDVRCASGQFRVYWDRDLTMLRCAVPTRSNVTCCSDG